MSQCYTAFELKINLHHSILYFTVQWFFSFFVCSEKHFSFVGKAQFRRATLSCDSSYFTLRHAWTCQLWCIHPTSFCSSIVCRISSDSMAEFIFITCHTQYGWYVIFSSTEPKAHRWAYSIGRHPSSVHRNPSTFSNDFSSEAVKPILFIFYR